MNNVTTQRLLYRKTLAITTASIAVVAFTPLSATADDAYPSKTVTIVVPFVPGGQGDVFARLLAQRLTTRLKQTFIVENRAGAAGAIGTRYVAKAKNDGYTLLLGQTGEIVVNGFVANNIGYNALKELKPIALIGESPLVMVAPSSSKFGSFKDVVAHAKANPNTVNYASSGTATPGHLAAAALALGTKTQMTHVPYKGAGQAMTDVIAGHVDFFMSSAAAAAGHIKTGKLKPLAVSTSRRVPSFKDAPTIAESGVPGFDYSLWGGLFAPSGTPEPIVKLLNAEVNALVSDPDFKQRMDSDGVFIRTNSPADFEKMVRQEADKYEKLVKETGIKAE